MPAIRFKLPIGAKRQVTIPKECMKLLSIEEGGELLLEIVGEHAMLLPMVSVPRRDLPEALRKKFSARRGSKETDIPLGRFLEELPQGNKEAASARGRKRKPVADAADKSALSMA